MHKFSAILLLILFPGCSTDQTNNIKKTPNATTTFTHPVEPLLIENGEEEGWGADI